MTQYSEQNAVHAMDDDMISLSEIAAILFRGRRWVIGITLASLVLALCYLFVTKPVYRASALIKIEQSQSSLILSLLDVEHVADLSISSSIAIEQLRSPGFIHNFIAAEQSHLDIPPFKVVKDVQERLQVAEKARGTGILEITVSGTNPQENIQLLNAIIDYYFEQRNQTLASSIEQSLALLKARLFKIQQEIALAQEQDVSVKSARFNELKLAQKAIQNNIDILENAKTIALNDRHVFSDPMTSEDPVSPKYTLVVVLVVMLGGMLGIVVVFAREMMRKVLRTSEEAENKTGLTLFAEVATAEELKKSPECRESFKVLRTNLLYQLGNVANNRAMVCSPSPVIEQDHVITQLASELAEAGKKVLLLDADLRQGRMFKHFDTTGGYGLAEKLVNHDHSAMTVSENLDLISGNSYPENPSEQLMSSRFQKLLDWGSTHYDVVLVSVPPILNVTDGAVVGSLCATGLMIIQAGQTTVKDIEAANRRLQQAGVMIDGAIFVKEQG